MTREELTKAFLSSTADNYILQLATGFGKSYMALQKVNQWYTKDCKILIAIPFNVLIDNWKDEIHKWKFDKLLPNITFTTYISLPKHCGEHWDILICDECHHISERCRASMKVIKTNHFIGLSATIKRDVMDYLRQKFHPEVFRIDVRNAIESNVLPDPKIILVRLKLDNTVVNQIIEKNIKRKSISIPKTIGYGEKWKYRSYKGPLHITCTQLQYYNDLSNLIEWYKQKGMHNAIMKNMWLHKAGERLKWLAAQKEDLIKDILKQLKNYRVLTFCQSIEQSETLGCPCVNSKVGLDNLDKFNSRKIKHIAAISILDEGANLVECKIGLFQMINSSLRMIVQRSGRIYRHKKPVLIFPYFVDTREEEIVDGIIKEYNPELVHVVEDINTIKNYL